MSLLHQLASRKDGIYLCLKCGLKSDNPLQGTCLGNGDPVKTTVYDPDESERYRRVV